MRHAAPLGVCPVSRVGIDDHVHQLMGITKNWKVSHGMVYTFVGGSLPYLCDPRSLLRPTSDPDQSLDSMNIANEGKEDNRLQFSNLMFACIMFCVFACQLHRPPLENLVMIIASYSRKAPQKVDRTTAAAQITGAKENSGTLKWPAALDELPPVLELLDPV